MATKEDLIASLYEQMLKPGLTQDEFFNLRDRLTTAEQLSE